MTIFSEPFPTETAGLPAAHPIEWLELADGDVLDLRIGPVAKHLGDATVRMLAYNGSVPGPTLRVRQGSELVVNVANETDLEATVHWHGLRLDNRFDGVPHVTQEPVPPGGRFRYIVRFPDAGIYWYHPHVREDVQQDLGLYGNLQVRSPRADYFGPAHREEVLLLDDVLLADDGLVPWGTEATTHALMGRFGDVLLINGDSAWNTEVSYGDIVRLIITNAASTP